MSHRRSLLSLGLPRQVLDTLVRHGYESLEDLTNVTPESLEKDLGIPINIARNLLNRFQDTSSLASTMTMTQTAAKLVENVSNLPTKCPALDEILGGGLLPGYVLEVSGPPGSPKEVIEINIIASAIEQDKEVVFIECQNAISPSILTQRIENSFSLKGDWKRQIHYARLHSLSDLLFFMHRFPTFLHSQRRISLLVVNLISAPFQSANLSISQRKAHLDTIRQAFSKICTLHGLAIVTISQMATKMLNPDGSPGTFDSGAKGVMSPQLGAGYLLNGKSHRVVLAPNGLDTGFIQLLSCPSSKKVAREVYTVVCTMFSAGFDVL